jgi:hypothetical protein
MRARGLIATATISGEVWERGAVAAHAVIAAATNTAATPNDIILRILPSSLPLIVGSGTAKAGSPSDRYFSLIGLFALRPAKPLCGLA